LNPAAFYKKSAQRLPDYFQVGTVIQGATEFYSSRLSKQQRGRSFAEELLHDKDIKFTLKKRFNKLQVCGREKVAAKPCRFEVGSLSKKARIICLTRCTGRNAKEWEEGPGKAVSSMPLHPRTPFIYLASAIVSSFAPQQNS
jgi:hypothetical protein